MFSPLSACFLNGKRLSPAQMPQQHQLPKGSCNKSSLPVASCLPSLATGDHISLVKLYREWKRQDNSQRLHCPQHPQPSSAIERAQKYHPQGRLAPLSKGLGSLGHKPCARSQDSHIVTPIFRQAISLFKKIFIIFNYLFIPRCRDSVTTRGFLSCGNIFQLWHVGSLAVRHVGSSFLTRD